MIELIGGILTSSGFGALTGIAGAWLSKREERAVLIENNKHAERMAELRTDEMAAEAELSLQLADRELLQAEAEGKIASDLEAGRAFTESQKQARQPTGIKLVDAIRGLMRPLITIYLLAVVSVLSVSLSRIIGGLESIPQVEALEIYKHVIYQTVYLAVMAVSWWFSSRPARVQQAGKA